MTTTNNKQFSKRFYIGIWLIIINLIIGKLTQAAFIFYFNNDFIRKLSVIIYLVSWPPFLLGIAWAGKEYVDKYNKYFTIAYYREKIKNRSQ